MIAFDKYMNFVLADTQEIRKTSSSSTANTMERRTLGLLIMRGDVIVSLSVEAPPPAAQNSSHEKALPAGPGIGRAAGRGLPMAGSSIPAGLSGPVGGIGGPASSFMAPGAGRGMPPMPPGFRAPPGFGN